MAEVYFSLGSNKGDRLHSLIEATKLIDAHIGKVILYSSVIESEPWGFNSETTFYNMVVLATTEFDPHQVLAKVLEIEASLGRTRHGKTYTDRIIDIDILFYGNKQITDKNLALPHPLLQMRLFVLQPLVEIAPDLIHPVSHKSMAELLLQLSEPGLKSIAVNPKEFSRLLKSTNQS